MADIIKSFGKTKLIDTGSVTKIETDGTVTMVIDHATGDITAGAVSGTGVNDIYSAGLRTTNYCFINSGGASPSARFYSKNAQSQELYQDDNGGVHIDGNKSYLKFPLLTGTQRDALTASAGMVVYNTTASKLQVYSGGVWVDLH